MSQKELKTPEKNQPGLKYSEYKAKVESPVKEVLVDEQQENTVGRHLGISRNLELLKPHFKTVKQ